MYYETDKNDHGLRYNPLKACVVPRPIGWLTTLSAAGAVNLAPFSFFNLLSYDPPFVMFSAGLHEVDGGSKDSVANVEATGEFVYSMATWAHSTVQPLPSTARPLRSKIMPIRTGDSSRTSVREERTSSIAKPSRPSDSGARLSMPLSM